MKRHGEITSSERNSAVAGAISVTPSGTISIDVSTGNYAKWSAGQNETVNATGTQYASQELTLIVTNDGVLPRVVTFGTGFVSIGILTGTVNKTSIVRFVSDGTNLYELCRTLLL
jgi:hypothetical protein